MGVSLYHIEIVLLWLLFTIMFNLVMCNLKVHYYKKDMNTLLNFKQGVTDPTSVLFSWSIEKDCYQRTGVQCDNTTGKVTELRLPCHAMPSAYSDKVDNSQCLTGEFELSLLDLEFLRHLNLSNNDFKAIQYNPMGGQKCNVLSTVHLPFGVTTSPTSIILIYRITMILLLIISIGFLIFPPCNILTLVVFTLTRKLIGFSQWPCSLHF